MLHMGVDYTRPRRTRGGLEYFAGVTRLYSMWYYPWCVLCLPKLASVIIPTLETLIWRTRPYWYPFSCGGMWIICTRVCGDSSSRCSSWERKNRYKRATIWYLSSLLGLYPLAAQARYIRSGWCWSKSKEHGAAHLQIPQLLPLIPKHMCEWHNIRERLTR